jgi:hypothetical protein
VVLTAADVNMSAVWSGKVNRRFGCAYWNVRAIVSSLEHMTHHEGPEYDCVLGCFAEGRNLPTFQRCVCLHHQGEVYRNTDIYSRKVCCVRPAWNSLYLGQLFINLSSPFCCNSIWSYFSDNF